MNKTIAHIQSNTWWKTLEVLGSYAIYLTHSYLLFLSVSSHFLGKLSTIHGAIFFLAAALRLGFEGTAATNFYYWSSSKSTFLHFLTKEAAPTIIFASLCILFISILYGSHLSWAEYTLSLLLLIFELSRKITKTFLNLLLQNKHTAHVELLQIIGFFILVWIPWTLGSQFTISTILFPHLIMLMITVALYCTILHNWYHTLPSACAAPYTPFNRLALSISQLIQQCCSTNAFILLIASYSGLTIAGECYLITNILYTCINIIERLYGSLFLASFSRNSQLAHSYRTQIILFAIICSTCLLLIATHHTLTITLIAGIIAIIFLEYALNYLEKKAIFTNAPLPPLINAIGLAVTIAALGFITPHPAILISSLLIMRLFSLIMIWLTPQAQVE